VEHLIELIAADVAPGLAREISVNDVSWTVNRGDWWVLAGPPNSGKSALLMTLGILNPAARGELRLFGQAVTQSMGDELTSIRRRIGMLFEDGGHLFDQSTVLENVALPLRYHHNLSLADAVERVMPFLEACGIAAFAAQNTRGVGRANRRRVALARALALQPELLLIDNPVAGLDPSQIRWWRGFLSQLNAGHPVLENRPVTLVLATDDLRPWLPLARQFALVRDRKLQALGGREELESKHGDLLAELLSEEHR
jgi:phospholipid/cholesterol/gamma-HCH transport system ATP-binding protein